MKCLPPMAVSLILSALMHANVRGQDSAPPPEMKALERLVGTWEVDSVGRIPKEPRSTAFVVKRELVLGGRFVQEMGNLDNGELISIGMYTYDSNRKTYRYWLFQSPEVLESTGTWDEISQTFTFVCKPGGFVYKPGEGPTATITYRFSNETTFDWSLILRGASGEVGYHSEGKAVRQK